MSRKLTHRHRFDGRPNTVVLLREAYIALNERALVRLAERGHEEIRPAHAAVFQYVDDDGTPVARLAERAQITKQSMAELVIYLEQRGYVTRVTDPSDRRAKLVLPTSRGQEVFALMRELVPEVELEIDETLGPKRAAALRQDLERLLGEPRSGRGG